VVDGGTAEAGDWQGAGVAAQTRPGASVLEPAAGGRGNRNIKQAGSRRGSRRDGGSGAAQSAPAARLGCASGSAPSRNASCPTRRDPDAASGAGRSPGGGGSTRSTASSCEASLATIAAASSQRLPSAATTVANTCGGRRAVLRGEWMGGCVSTAWLLDARDKRPRGVGCHARLSF
jgi:hypothetical protein